MNSTQNVLMNNIQFSPDILSHGSNLNPNAPVFVPRWLQPPMATRQNATIWTQTNEVFSIIQEFPDNSKRRRIITTEELIALAPKAPGYYERLAARAQRPRYSVADLCAQVLANPTLFPIEVQHRVASEHARRGGRP